MKTMRAVGWGGEGRGGEGRGGEGRGGEGRGGEGRGGEGMGGEGRGGEGRGGEGHLETRFITFSSVFIILITIHSCSVHLNSSNILQPAKQQYRTPGICRRGGALHAAG